MSFFIIIIITYSPFKVIVKILKQHNQFTLTLL